MNYYFLASSLPTLQIGMPIELSFYELAHLLSENLSPKDLMKAKVIRCYYDIINIRLFLQNETLDHYGNYDTVELEETLVTRFGLPPYVFAFIDEYKSDELRVLHFSQLVASYFRHEIAAAEGFLHTYLTFEREWRLVFVAFRAKMMGRNITEELSDEPLDDDLVMQIIAQKDAKSFEPPYRYSDLKSIFESYQEDPLELHKAICEYRFAKIKEMVGTDMFSINRILGYMALLIIAERWLELDREKGIEMIDLIVKEAS